jgi:hypothetical protein
MEWTTPHEGFEYTHEVVSLDEQEQAARLAACGLDTDVFEGNVDPAFFIGIAIHSGIRSGISAEGNINMLQSLVQHRPVKLGQPLNVRGRITEVTEVPRGQTVATDVWFEDEAGNRAITATRRSLRPLASKQREAGATTRGAGERPPPVIEDVSELNLVSEHTLTPHGVQAYSSSGNAIHYNMQAANQAGFRAPMIGGGMGVHFLTNALWRQALCRKARVSHVDLDIFFRRPIFWDASFNVSAAPHAACLWASVNGVDKVLTEARINQ